MNIKIEVDQDEPKTETKRKHLKPLTAQRRERVNFFFEYSTSNETNFGPVLGNKWICFLAKFIDYDGVDENVVRTWLQRNPELGKKYLPCSSGSIDSIKVESQLRRKKAAKFPSAKKLHEGSKNTAYDEEKKKSWIKLLNKLNVEASTIFLADAQNSHSTSSGHKGKKIKDIKPISYGAITATARENALTRSLSKRRADSTTEALQRSLQSSNREILHKDDLNFFSEGLQNNSGTDRSFQMGALAVQYCNAAEDCRSTDSIVTIPIPRVNRHDANVNRPDANVNRHVKEEPEIGMIEIEVHTTDINHNDEPPVFPNTIGESDVGVTVQENSVDDMNESVGENELIDVGTEPTIEEIMAQNKAIRPLSPIPDDVSEPSPDYSSLTLARLTTNNIQNILPDEERHGMLFDPLETNLIEKLETFREDVEWKHDSTMNIINDIILAAKESSSRSY